MKWITAHDLNSWADTIESRSLLPELVKRLIAATIPICDTCIFPSRESIQLPGWDGVLRVVFSSRYCSNRYFFMGVWYK